MGARKGQVKISDQREGEGGAALSLIYKGVKSDTGLFITHSILIFESFFSYEIFQKN